MDGRIKRRTGSRDWLRSPCLPSQAARLRAVEARDSYLQETVCSSCSGTTTWYAGEDVQHIWDTICSLPHRQRRSPVRRIKVYTNLARTRNAEYGTNDIDSLPPLRQERRQFASGGGRSPRKQPRLDPSGAAAREGSANPCPVKRQKITLGSDQFRSCQRPR